MELIHRIYAFPFEMYAQLLDYLAGECLGVTQQGIEMGTGVEQIVFAPKRTAIAAQQVMLLHHQDAQSLADQTVGGDQAGDAGADYHAVIAGVRGFTAG